MKRIAVTLAALLVSVAAHAETNWTNALDYTTLGIWANAPLGVSARGGLAIPVHDKKNAVTHGH